MNPKYLKELGENRERKLKERIKCRNCGIEMNKYVFDKENNRLQRRIYCSRKCNGDYNNYKKTGRKKVTDEERRRLTSIAGKKRWSSISMEERRKIFNEMRKKKRYGNEGQGDSKQ